MLKKIFDDQNNSLDFINKTESDYSFQKVLTKELDFIESDSNEMTMLKIILWKTNRYPELKPDTLKIINELRTSYTLDKARTALFHLLELKGFDLPMASTVLRFACPNELQIIDKWVYRFIMPEDKLKIPYNKTEKVELYFKYIEELKMISRKYNIPFHKSDRILYQLDKNLNTNIPIDY